MVTLTNLLGNIFFPDFSCTHGRSRVYGPGYAPGYEVKFGYGLTTKLCEPCTER